MYQHSISVIVPVYNAEQYIGNTISLLLNQSFRDFELVLVDDGSSDSSLSICEEYAHKDSRIIPLHKENGGSSDARNYGMKHAKGEFICFIDADDEVTDSYLEDLYDNLHRYPDADFVIQGMTKVWPDKKKEYVLKDATYCVSPDGMTSFFNDVNLSNFSGPYCKLFRHNIIEEFKILFSENIIYAEDYDFVLRYIPHCRNIVTSSKTNYKYLLHGGSVSSKIYSFERELSGLNQISGSYLSIDQSFPSDNLKKLASQCICDYFWRVIFANYQHGYSFFQRINNFGCIPNNQLQYLKKNYTASSYFTKLVKYLMVHKMYLIANILLTIRLGNK